MQPLRQLGAQVLCQSDLPRAYLPNRLSDHLTRRRLPEIASCPGFKRGVDVLISLLGREDKYACIRKLRTQASDDLNSIHIRQVQFHNEHVRKQLPEESERLGSIAR